MSRARATPRPGRRPGPLDRHERLVAAGLLAVHVALLGWVAARNSVTFDENFHVPAGVRIVTAGDFATSYAQPPLPKALYGLAALAAGARAPDPAVARPGAERFAGHSFMRRNAARYHQVYLAARAVAIALSAALAVAVWRVARGWWGARGGLAALALIALLPEILAHGSLAGVDVPTALAMFLATLAWLGFVRTGRGGRFAWAALWTSVAFLTRFSAVQLLPAFVAIAAVAHARGRAPRPARLWWGLAAMPLVALLALATGYGFQSLLRPLGAIELHSAVLRSLQGAVPALPLPLPEDWIRGADYVAFLAEPGRKASFLLGAVRDTHAWWYLPVAIAVKWPLALLLLVAWRLVRALRDPGGARAAVRDTALLAPVLVVLGAALVTSLDFGVRYAIPALPFLAVWIARLASERRPRRAGSGAAALVFALLALLAVETAPALPHPLAFFNALAGGRGDRIVNDSNVDWGQGLIALREELARRGIARVHLLYHGTADPALYGLDYVLYTGRFPGPESDWFAVSSYFLVGLPGRLTTAAGMSEQAVRFDLGGLKSRPPAARPAGAMYLFRIR